MDVVYAEEKLTRQFISEVEDMVAAHWDEAYEGRGKAKVDWVTYQALQDAGTYHMFTVRVDGKLCGYAGYIVTASIQSIGVIQALGDMIYITPNCRGKMYSVRLMKFAETKMIQLGVHVIGQSVKAHHDFSAILERLGYGLDEYYYSKRIG